MMLRKVRDGIRKHVLDKTNIDEYIAGGVNKVKKEVRKHIITAITAAFGFLIALSWRDAITIWINHLVDTFQLSKGWYQFIGALIVTIIGVLGIIIVSRFEEKPVNTKIKK